MNDKIKLYIITQNYPYGSGEKTFVEPEIASLLQCELFDITVISNSTSTNLQITKLPKEVHIKKIERKSIFKMPQKAIRYIYKYFASNDTKEERKDIWSCDRALGKLIDSLIFYIQTQIFMEQIYLDKIDFENAIVYTYWDNIETLAMAFYKKNKGNMKLISRINGYDLYDERTWHGRQPFRKFIDKELDRLFFVAQTGRDYYSAKLGKSQRYIVNYLGTKNGMDINKKKLTKSFLLISCASVIPLKRIDLIIRSLKNINDFDLTWIHFGDGSMRVKMEKLAKKVLQNKMNISYIFKGYMDNEKIMDFYEKNYVDCFITTSETEGCPVSIQEALAFGIPVIGTAVGEIPLMIRKNGILLSANPKVEEITNAIKSIQKLGDDEKKTMRKESRMIWEQNFDGIRNRKEFINELLSL